MKEISYILNHLGEERGKYFNAMSPPIMQTSNFKFDSVADFKKAVGSERENHIYSRGNNPNLSILEKKLAALHQTEDALITSSGAAAITNAVMANIQAGDHVICIKNVYTWADRLFNQILKKFDVETTMVDGRKIENFEAAIQPNTRMIYLESPTSLTFDLQDLEAVAKLAKSKNILTVMDHTFGGPMNTYPLEAGIDILIHTASKYIGGHSDVIGGVIYGTKAMMDKIFSLEFMTFGNVMSPHNAWLLTRSLRTLPLRLERTSKTCSQVLAFLETHNAVKSIKHPNHKDHPQQALGIKQFTQIMPLFSVEFKCKDVEKIHAFCDALTSFQIAVSWGGHESLVLPVTFDYYGVETTFVRFYIGLEEPDFLIKDIEQAIKLFD